MSARLLRYALACVLQCCAVPIVHGASAGDIVPGAPYFVDVPGFVAEAAIATAIQPDGNILLVGRATSGDTTDMMVVRLLPDGSADPAFGSAGQVRLNFGPGVRSSAAWVGIRGDGRIVVVGSVVEEPDFTLSIAIVRLLPGGEPDTSFSVDGRVRIGADIGAFCGGGFLTNELLPGSCGAALLDDDSLVVAGGTGSLNGALVVHKIRHDGSLDPVFGRRVYGLLGGPESDSVGGYSAVVRARVDGRLLVMARGNPNAEEQTMAVLRLRADGALDTSFGQDGAVLVPTEPNEAFLPVAMVLDASQRIVVAATGGVGGQVAYAAARFLPDGQPDATFGSAGVAAVVWDGVAGESDTVSHAHAVHADSGGRVYVVGQVEQADIEAQENTDVGVARFTATGLPDLAFGPGGKRTYNFDVSFGGPVSVRREHAFAVARDGQGRLLLAGDDDGLDDFDAMQLWRIYTDDLFADDFD